MMGDWLEGIPRHVREAIQPLFDVLPPNRAMDHLLAGVGQPHIEMAAAEADRQLMRYPLLQAGLWLYVDDLDRSHKISQQIPSKEGAYWHGIVHRREGDFSNAKYWFHQAGSLPNQLGLDPASLTDEVASHIRDNPTHLVEAQRREWEILFGFCARQIE